MGESRNPSDPADYGLDPKTATLRIKFRVRPIYAPVAMHRLQQQQQQSSVKWPKEDDDDPDHDDYLPGWEGVLYRGRLYITATAEHLVNGSKEAFVSLLEYAEDVLGCSHVVVCLQKPAALLSASAASARSLLQQEAERELKKAIRNFLFLGFQPLAAGHEFVPSDPDLVCFVYTV